MPTTISRGQRSETTQGETVPMQCTHCRNEIDGNNYMVVSQPASGSRNRDRNVCDSCISAHYQNCEHCDELTYDSELVSAYNSDGDEINICGECFNNDFQSCNQCGSIRPNDEISDGICEGCEDSDHIRYREWKEMPDKHQSKEAGKIIKSPRLWGVELETTFGGGSESRKRASKVSKDMPSEIGVQGDGSISGMGLEIITPPLRGKKGEETINEICEILSKGRALLDKSCGYHIHIGVKDVDNYDPSSQFVAIRTLWLFYIVFEDVITSFLSPSRRMNRYCKSLVSDYHFKEIYDARNMDMLERIWYRVTNSPSLNQAKAEKKHETRYRGVNMHTLFAERHIEIRYHMGTVVARKVLEWANLHLKIADLCILNYNSIDVGRMRDYLSMSLPDKTNLLFSILKLQKTSEDYFRTRQIAFAPKATSTIDEANRKDTEKILLGEQEN